MNEELMRRISHALDAEGGLEADAELRARLDDDAEARAYAEDLKAIDAALRELGSPGHAAAAAAESDSGAEPDWDALAASIDARLDADESLDDIGDVTGPPLFADDPVEDGSASDRSVGGSTRSAFGASPAAPEIQPREGQVVDLAGRRRRGRSTLFATLGGLAAAAAVALGVTAGLSTMSGDEAPVASAPASGAVMVEEAEELAAERAPSADVPSGAAADGWLGAEVAEGEVGRHELPAAAAAEPFLAPAEDLDVAEAEPMAQEQMQRAATRSALRRQRASRARRGSSGGRAPSAEPARPADDGLFGGARERGAGGSAQRWAPRAAARPAPSGPTAPEPSRVDAMQALRRVERSVQRCMGEQREVARVALDVRPDGAITTVNVAAPFAGTAAARCMETAIRTVRMPEASGPYVFTHAFRPAPIAGSSTGTSNAMRRPARHRAAPAPAQEAAADEAFHR